MLSLWWWHVSKVGCWAARWINFLLWRSRCQNWWQKWQYDWRPSWGKNSNAVKTWYAGMSCIVPTCPLCAIEDPDKLYQKLTKDRWRAVSGGYCHDDWIHVDAKARKIDDGYHGAKSGNGSLCLRLVHVEDIHALLCVSDHVLHTHLLDHACVPLRKKRQWVVGVCFAIEGSDSVGGKVST